MNKLASLDKFVTNWDIAINCIKCYNIKRINTVSFGYCVLRLKKIILLHTV